MKGIVAKKEAWLWMIVLPISVVGIFWNTEASITVAIFAFGVLEFFVPFGLHTFRFVRGRGIEAWWRAAAHGVLWPVVSFWLLAGLWVSLSWWETLRTEFSLLFILSAVGLMAFIVWMAERLSARVAWCYGRLKQKGDLLRYIITASCITGLLPLSLWMGMVLVFFFSSNGTSPWVMFFFFSQMIGKMALLKLVLVMGMFAFYFYFALSGKRLHRFLETVVGALFYLALLLLPSLLLSPFPVSSPAVMCADPLFLLTMPILSDVFVSGISIYGAMQCGNLFWGKS